MNHLKHLRESRDLSQRQLADLLGLSQQSIYKYEKDLAEPDFYTLKAFADFFHTSIDFLLDYKPDTCAYTIRENGPELSPSEVHHLNLYRRIPTGVQAAFNVILAALTSKGK